MLDQIFARPRNPPRKLWQCKRSQLLPVSPVAQVICEPDWNHSVTGYTGRNPVHPVPWILTWMCPSFGFQFLSQVADGAPLIPTASLCLDSAQVKLRLSSNHLWVTADFWDVVCGDMSIPFPELVFLATNIHFSGILQPKGGRIQLPMKLEKWLD